jgi:hypothetical protein
MPTLVKTRFQNLQMKTYHAMHAAEINNSFAPENLHPISGLLMVVDFKEVTSSDILCCETVLVDGELILESRACNLGNNMATTN